MAKWIKGQQVILHQKRVTGKDPFGGDLFEWETVIVQNVLIAPSSAEEITTQFTVTGRHAVYTLAIPKGDTHVWEEGEVEFFHQRWRVFGKPLQGMDSLIPLDWNKKVTVERFE